MSSGSGRNTGDISPELASSILGQLHLAMVVLKPVKNANSTIEDFNIMFCNDAGAEMLGCSSEDEIQDSLLTAKSKSNLSDSVNHLIAFYEQEEEQQTFFSSSNLQGASTDYYTVTKVLDGQQILISLPTGHKEAVHKYLDKEEKHLLTERIGRNFIHEFGNPLSSVSLAIGAIREELGEDANGSLKILESSIDKIINILKEFHHSIKSPNISNERISLQSVLDEALEAVRISSEIRRASIQKDFGDIEFSISGDRQLLIVALFQLITNALESTEVGEGKITLTLRPILFGYELRIQDNGSGIPKEHLDQIFEPFFTSKGNHLGLGLTYVESVILAHGIGLNVESEMDEGTSFCLMFRHQ